MFSFNLHMKKRLAKVTLYYVGIRVCTLFQLPYVCCYFDVMGSPWFEFFFVCLFVCF